MPGGPPQQPRCEGLAQATRDFCGVVSGLGSAGGFERLHYLLEHAWDGPELGYAFLKVGTSAPTLPQRCLGSYHT